MDAWREFCECLAPEGVASAILDDAGEMDPVERVCEIAEDDILENPNPYDDMLESCLDRVNAKGYAQGPADGTVVPEFPPFTQDLRDRAELLLETRGWSFDSHEIIEGVFTEATTHYLGWCKKVITEHWSTREATRFADLVRQCSPRDIPVLLVPREGRADVVVVEDKTEGGP